MLIKLENKNPTETEKNMFLYNGYYVVERYSAYDHEHLKYAVCHLSAAPKEFPEVLEIEEDRIDRDETICFECLSETLTIHGMLDTLLLQLLLKRAKKLGRGIQP